MKDDIGHLSLQTIEEKAKIRKELFDKYQVSSQALKQIFNHSVREVKLKIKLKLIEGNPALQGKKAVLFNKIKQEYKKISKKVIEQKGFWMHGKSGTKYKDLEPLQQTYLECQIHKLIELKYNLFITTTPTIKDQDIEDLEDEDELEQQVIQKECFNQTNSYNVLIIIFKTIS